MLIIIITPPNGTPAGANIAWNKKMFNVIGKMINTKNAVYRLISKNKPETISITFMKGKK